MRAFSWLLLISVFAVCVRTQSHQYHRYEKRSSSSSGSSSQDNDGDDYLSIGGADIEHRPTIILQPGSPGPLEWREGEDVYSQCSVAGSSSNYMYRWIRRLPNGQVEELSSRDILSIPSVRREQVQYPIFCVVTSLVDGSVYEEMLNLRVVSYERSMRANHLQLIIVPLPAEDLRQGRVMRQCLFEGQPGVNEMYDFRWLDHNGRVVNNGDSLILLLDNLDDLRNYTCEATSRQTGVVYQAKYAVSEQPTTQDMHYTVVIQPMTAEVIVGRPYEMICKVEPEPDVPVSIEWFHNNRLIGRQPTIRVSSLAYPDLGQYICRAQWTPRDSRSGPMSANSTMEINLALTREMGIDLSPPPGSILVTLPGEMRELHCEFERSNPRDVRWYFEGEPLEYHPTLNRSGTVHQVDRLRVSIVILRRVEMAQAGTYECRYENVVKQSHVMVRGERYLEINPETDTVDVGASVEFHCREQSARENVNREMEWFYRSFHGGQMVPLSMISDGFIRSDDPYASHTSFISKIAVRKANEGEYICRLPSRNAEAIAKLFVRASVHYVVTITPSIVRVRPNQRVELECFVSDEQGRPASVQPRFRVHDSRLQYETTTVGANRIRFISHGIDQSFNGTQVECYTDQASNTAIALIVVEGTCPPGFRRCRNGECLPAGRFCDGHPDCSDRSDEDPANCNSGICDPIAKKCEYYQNRAPLKNFYMIHWECDGEDDCGNGFDESRCPDPDVARCEGPRYTCSSGHHSIPLAYVCDKEPDCPNHEDERNCAIPTIQTVTDHRHPVRVGGSVVLICRVTGFPIPRVIWRFNWACLPDEGVRFRVTSVAEGCNGRMPTVISTLTITDLHYGDDGIYNCEALSGGMRAMSNDYHVMFEG